jgi:hypothetical protein
MEVALKRPEMTVLFDIQEYCKEDAWNRCLKMMEEGHLNFL